MDEEITCAICQKSLDNVNDVVTLREKGSEGINRASTERSGGSTRGRGFTEQQRLIWLLSMPACAETNRAMQELTGVKSNSGEQNKDMSKAR